MRPEKVTFYVYADSQDEAKSLEDSLYSLVDGLYRKGSLVTAKELLRLLKQFSPIINGFFRKHG